MSGHHTPIRNTIVLTPRLCKAGRALLGWLQTDLSEHSGVGIATIRAYESEARGISKLMLVALERAFTDAGLEFDRGGVVFRELMAA
jgi:hypothetical protein